MHFFTFFFRSLLILLSLSLLDKAHGQALPLRYTDAYRGNFLLIGNTLAQDAGPGIPAPLVGTVGAAGSNTSDSAPDVFWRSDSPSSGEAEANTSITAANARSAAILTIPVGAVVKKAYLYWGAGLLANSTTIQPTANLQIGTATPINLQADAFTQRVASQQLAYQAVKDITELVQANGSEKYTVSGVQSPPLRNVSDNVGFVAWSMVVFYESNSEPYRSLALNDGLAYVQSGQPYSATYSDLGLINGSVKLGIVAYEGDGVTFGGGIGDGDGLYINGAAQSNALNPADNFFNNTRSTDGVAVSVVGDLPQLTGGVGSMSGIDLDILDITGSVVQGASSYTVRTTSNGDAYFIGVLASSTEAILPTPTISNLGANADPVCSGSPVTFTATIGNITGPYDFTLTNGGIGQSTGTTSGTAFSQSIEATGSGVQSVTLIISDNGQSTLAITSITVNELPLVSNPLVTNSSIGTAFNQSFTSSGGQNPYTYSLASGSPPEGVTLAPTGLLSGTPTQIGNFSLTVQATDSRGCVGVSTPYYLTVNEAAGPIRYVKAIASGTGDGSSWNNASSNLQAMINATGVQQVWVAAGTYKPTTNTDRTISFSLKNNVAVYGGFTGNETSLDQRPAINPVSGPGGASQPSSSTLSGDIGTVGVSSDNSYHVLYLSAGLNNTAVLDGFSITAGNADDAAGQHGYGGGIYTTGSSPIIIRCSFLNNSARVGGGLYNIGNSQLTLTDCRFEDNSATGSGGGMGNNGGVPTLTNCLFVSNSASYFGGGMENRGNSRLTLRGCRFEGNTTGTFGGGIYNSFTNLTLINCAFERNSAGSGAGAIGANTSVTSTLINCSFLNNSVTSSNSTGGAILNTNTSTMVLTNSSFQGNSPLNAGGIHTSSGSTSTLTNCVLFGNGSRTITNNGGGTTRVRFSLVERSVTGFTDEGNNQTSTGTPFVSTSSTQLLGCSPAINAGTNSATGLSDITTDLAGNPRFYEGGVVDMGAYEYQGDPITVTVTNPIIATATVGQPFSQSFAASGGSSPYSFSVANGSLPTGLSLATNGVLSGTPTQSGSFTITVQAIDANSCVGTSGIYSLTVTAALPIITGFAATASTVCVGSPVTFTATVGNVTGSYGYTLTSGSSVVNGTASSPTFSQTLVASGSGSQSFSLTINNNGQLARATTSFTAGSHPDYQPLVDLYNSTNGAGWTNKTGWLTNCDPCSGWYGIGCTEGRVTTIALFYNQLSGRLPLSLGSLTNLQHIDLQGNQLSEGIPTSFSALTSLTYLRLTNNPLGGEIPSGLGKLTNLTYLELVNNQLSGGIPTSLSALTKLTTLNLGVNALSGEIPASLGALTNLKDLNLVYNHLSGSIPSSLSNLTNLQGAGFQNNNLKGCYPSSLTALCGVINNSFYNNVGLPGEGSEAAFNLFCSTGQGSDTFVPTATASVAVACEGGVVSLSTTGGSSYNWLAPSGAVLTSSASSSVVSARLTTAGVKTFTVVVGQGGSCSQTATVSLTVTSSITATITPSTNATLTCASPTVSLLASGGDTYRWEDNSTNPNRTVNSAGIYSVTATSSSGCSATANTTITDDQVAPPLSITASGTALSCSSPTTSLTALGTGNLLWSNGSTNAVITVNEGGTYSVTLTAPNGCTSSTSITLEQDQVLPMVRINASTTTISCSSPSVSLTAVGTGNLIWSTGSIDPQVTVSTAGTYSVTLTGTNGCSASTSVSITQDIGLPTVSIQASQTLLTCASPTASLSAIGTGSYLWSTGATSPVISVSATGTYSVTLIGANGCSSIASATLTDDQSDPLLSIAASQTLLTCASPAASLTALGTGTFLWSTGSTNGQILASSSGTYSVTLTAPTGCTASTSITIDQDTNLPSVSITPTSTTLTCSNPSVTLTANGTGTYLWNTGTTSQTINATSAGTYSVTLTATNGCSASASFELFQDTNSPSVSITPTSATLTCTNPSATLTANGIGTYLWSTGATSQTINATSAGAYSVTITATNGCTASAGVLIEQGADQTIGFTQQPVAGTSVTVGSTVTAQVVISGQPTAYQWYKDNLSQPLVGQKSAQLMLANVQLSDQGAYFVVVSGLCNSLTSTAFSLSVTNPVTSLSLTVSVSPNPIQVGQLATLTATVSGGNSPYSFSFNGPGTINPSENSATVSGLSAGVYSFTVRASDSTLPTAQLATSIVSLTVNTVETAPFTLTGVTTVACSPSTSNRYSVTFMPQYVGQSGEPVSFSVVNELLPTTQPGPYTMQLYTDNPVITLQATQQGRTTRFVYNWLATCEGNTGDGRNTPPRVVTPIANQTARMDEYFTFVIPGNTFTDSETPQGLALSVTGLPTGLSFSGATISGSPSTTVGSPFTVSVTATDPGQLSVSNQFVLTILPATETPLPTQPFAITGVTTISCTPVADRISVSFAPQYIGLNGQSIAFEVVNETAPTATPAPYSLTLYRDNPVITLRARQTGSVEVASFTYNWLAACSTTGQDNTPPRINSPVDSQTATVGQAFNLNVANTFADQETPNQVVLTASGLPAGLVLMGTAISGTPSVSGVSTIILTATDGGGLTNSISFVLMVSPASSTTVTPPTAFTIKGVQTVSCESLSGGKRRVIFQPQYSGVNGQSISFRVENELLATTASGPYTLHLYTDNPTISLKATQQGSAGEASFQYNWQGACTAPARLGAGLPESGLAVSVLGNPVEDEWVTVEIRGAAGQWLILRLVDQQGKQVSTQRLEQANSVERLRLPVGHSRGMLLLSVQTTNQQQQVKVLVH